MESKIDYGYKLNGYAKDDITKLIYSYLDRDFNLVEVLIENGYKPNDLDEDDEDDYEVLLSLIKREVVECIEEGLSVLLRE